MPLKSQLNALYFPEGRHPGEQMVTATEAQEDRSFDKLKSNRSRSLSLSSLVPAPVNPGLVDNKTQRGGSEQPMEVSRAAQFIVSNSSCTVLPASGVALAHSNHAAITSTLHQPTILSMAPHCATLLHPPISQPPTIVSVASNIVSLLPVTNYPVTHAPIAPAITMTSSASLGRSRAFSSLSTNDQLTMNALSSTIQSVQASLTSSTRILASLRSNSPLREATINKAPPALKVSVAASYDNIIYI